MRRLRFSPPRLAALFMLGLCTLTVGACGDTLQDQPISHTTLESLLLAPYPVYWLGGSFQRMAITEASEDPSGAFTVQYGDCAEGGQNTCVPRLRVVTSPDNSFIPFGSQSTPRDSHPRRHRRGGARRRDDRASHRRRGCRHLRQQSQPRSHCRRDGRTDQRHRRSRRLAAGAASRHRLCRAAPAGPDATPLRAPN